MKTNKQTQSVADSDRNNSDLKMCWHCNGTGACLDWFCQYCNGAGTQTEEKEG